MYRLVLLLGLLTFSCVKNKAGDVYFSGEIANPTSKYVVLYHNDIVLDSVSLDANNRFVFRLDNMEEGLYYFFHFPEYQYVYMKQGDSILMSFDAKAGHFDESLVFSGNNQEINNFLIRMFLTHEREGQQVFSYYSLPPKDFASKIDSLRNIKHEELKELARSNDFSIKARSILRASIDYNYFTHKERYPLLQKGMSVGSFEEEFGPEFHSYRSQVEFNNKELYFYRPYNNYLRHHIANLSSAACYNECGKEGQRFRQYPMHLIGHKFTIADDIIKGPGLRDEYLRSIMINFLLRVHIADEDCGKLVNKFVSLCRNKEYNKEIKQVYRSIVNLQPGKGLPYLVLEDTEGNTATLKEISKGHTTVFYFWSSKNPQHFKMLREHIAKLGETHPNLNFVGINLMTERGLWLEMLEVEGFDKKAKQYRANDFKSVQNTLLIKNLNKCLIVNDTLISDGFADMYSSFDQYD